MVSLEADGCIRPGQDNLRESAFWYPRIPETSLHLNEGSFIARETAMTRYDPVCWTMFGGPGGIHLGFLIGISATVDGGCLKAIEFHYNTKHRHFKIDGPGGEVVNSVTIYTHQYGLWHNEPGVLVSFKVSTNYGNSYHFEPTLGRATNRTASVERTITLIEGSTVNGLYWTQHRNRITALRAIS